MADDEKPDDDEPSDDDDAGAPSPWDEERRARLARLLSIRGRALTVAEVAELRRFFPVIFRTHFEKLWKRLNVRGLCKQDAEDLVMLTFKSAFSEICATGFEDGLDALLNRTLKGKLLNFIRARKRNHLSYGIPSSSNPAVAGPAPDPDRVRDREDLEKKVRPLLSDKLWEVVELVLFNGLEPAEAAEILGLPEGTVHSRLKRAKGRLAKLAHCWVPSSKRDKLGGRAA